MTTTTTTKQSDSSATSLVCLPRELVDRLIERLNKAQIFALATELRTATTAPQAATLPRVSEQTDERALLSDERIDQLARYANLDGSMVIGKREDYWRSFARSIEKEVRAALTQQAAPEAPASDEA